jgi:hypothetical protein
MNTATKPMIPVNTLAAIARKRFVDDLLPVSRMGTASYLKQPYNPPRWLVELFPDHLDQWRLLIIAQTLEDLMMCGAHETENLEGDDDHATLADWYTSDVAREAYCNQAILEGKEAGVETFTTRIILAMGQRCERLDVLHRVESYLKRYAEDLAESIEL